ncbi:class I SAM-dependent methyltransferase [Streptomyces sp. 4503]|uniref:S-adenosyl-L-methionine-dependent methyltransferase n=1 Tax=Streptomyces niphimycinicus TaxID=2842201 RepID=A0ABS6CFM6_9ACTN|nr:class I SAM-dependent methyltransferase [Streptomyces niphimycinicus]MBU3865722.1 class I SAM-dependent methyltransferase [Streptomyces niphimycinicus]
MADTAPESSTRVAGVGRTALLVAAARAIETSRPDAPARDAYAEHFVRAASGCADWPRRFEEVPDGDADPLWGRLARFFGLRTRVFDDFLLSAAAGGCRQVVVLGAGLDTRAYRLPWPDGSTVFEIDQEEVLAFKQSVLDTLGAVPRAGHVALAADLRRDWTGALTAAGFDPTRPTAWLAEGLVPYLPPVAEWELLATINAHSSRGSVLGCEVKYGVNPAGQRDYPVYAAVRERLGIDLLALFSTEPRPDTVADLTARGWSTAVHTPFDVPGRHDDALRPVPDDALAANRWILAVRSSA